MSEFDKGTLKIKGKNGKPVFEIDVRRYSPSFNEEALREADSRGIKVPMSEWGAGSIGAARVKAELAITAFRSYRDDENGIALKKEEWLPVISESVKLIGAVNTFGSKLQEQFDADLAVDQANF